MIVYKNKYLTRSSNITVEVAPYLISSQIFRGYEIQRQGTSPVRKPYSSRSGCLENHIFFVLQFIYLRFQNRDCTASDSRMIDDLRKM
jgi:hypothetical protein